MRKLGSSDLVGLGWRPQLAPWILSHLDQIDVLEIIIDDFVGASPQVLRAIQTLSKQVPILYHGVGLGLASTHMVDLDRVQKLARVLDVLKPEIWSEHLSFVRAGGHEIGHLAAPPRNAQTIEGTLRNLNGIRKIMGSLPALENIATLVDPPGSQMTETEWISQILRRSGASMLLDLHNLYANAMNFGWDPMKLLKALPLEKVSIVHLSGGHWVNEPKKMQTRPHGQRLLDDHVHDVPEAVFELLGELGKQTPLPLAVIIERDGQFPAFETLMKQVRRAREVLMQARRSRRTYQGEWYERTSL